MYTIIACIKYIQSRLISAEQQQENDYTINPYDLYMLNQLIEFKKNVPCRLVSVTMGPLGCIEAIRRSIAIGLDESFLVSDPCFSGSDTYATSYILSKALDYIGQADLYTFGEKAVDGETGQVPISVASRMKLQCVTGVKEFSDTGEGKIVLKREFADDFESIEMFTPSFLCYKGFTTKEPQISLLKLKRARSYSPIVLTAESLNIEKQYCGQDGSKTIVKNIAHAIPNRDVELLEGSSQCKADAFRKLILESGRKGY